ncbi:hypothetical protein CLPUN_06180 [Clostridium puniceum]|uniref:Uncharacterized protein n=1 Tax=Clostridium puniceum TaxID=29367 RepID=A0A1S8TW85_9CLOT|nr:hypothetical protein CLPUN_06180 [Clostridium puniceum]
MEDIKYVEFQTEEEFEFDSCVEEFLMSADICNASRI